MISVSCLAGGSAPMEGSEVESWWGSLGSGSQSSFISEGLMLFCASFLLLGNLVIMDDYKPGSKTGALLLRRKCSQSVHPTHLFIQAASVQVTATTNNSGCSRYREEFIPHGALCGEEFVPGFSWTNIPGGVGIQLLWIPQEKDDTEECLAENQLLLPTCESLMCLIRPLLTIQRVKRQFCFLPEGLVWEQRT